MRETLDVYARYLRDRSMMGRNPLSRTHPEGARPLGFARLSRKGPLSSGPEAGRRLALRPLTTMWWACQGSRRARGRANEGGKG